MSNREEESGQPRKGVAVGLGLALILTGLVINREALGELARSQATHLPFLMARGVLVLLGVGILFGRPRVKASGVTRILGALLVGVAVLGLLGEQRRERAMDEARTQMALLEQINRSEDLIQWLSSKFGGLNAAVLNLKLPTHKSLQLFEEQLSLADIGHALPGAEEDELGEGLLAGQHWTVEESMQLVAAEDANLWRPFLDDVAYFEHAKFYLVRGTFQDPDEKTFEAEMGFAGRARLKSGQVAYAHASQLVLWADHSAEDAEPDEREWRIRSWKMVKFGVELADDLLFDEVLDAALLDPETLREARRSRHQELIVDIALNGAERPEWFDMVSGDRHPGVAVLDVDEDGFDDLYVMPRFGPNQLLRNRGDGTFEDVADQYGLDLVDHTSCAVFADFDNDGDSDAFLGRTLARSLYLENEDGRFVARPERVGIELPYSVSSLSAVDYDNDGLLDVYFATYAARRMHQELKVSVSGGLAKGRSLAHGRSTLLEAILPVAQAERLLLLYQAAGNPFLARPGPPNVLLKNVGNGRFEAAQNAEPTEVWRNSYQATWADYDGDGDQDLYSANDFGPNNLVRNEGNGTFVDVTSETNTEDIGLGMGATWGDYNNDGTQDLYVSNMFSKAGRRITAQIGALDPTFAAMARGNSLLRQRGGTFERVSSLEPPGLLVEKAGWSWGPQFFDFDNDGFLDLFALSGFYTAPSQIALPVDR